MATNAPGAGHATKPATEQAGQHGVAPPPTAVTFQGEEHADGHGHDHGHGPLMHHFDDMEQQRESISIGMWTFLMTEIMMFSGLFFCYTLFRGKFYDGFALGSQQLSILWGTGNTFVLLASSMTMALAVHAAQEKNRKALVTFLLATIVLGSAFLGIKAIEWTADYHEGLVPTFEVFGKQRGNWDPSKWPTVHKAHLDVTPDETHVPDLKRDKLPVPVQHVRMYFMLYFCMTGLHAIHMVAGILILIPLVLLSGAGWFTKGNDQPIEIFGLYWHFVDIVWVFLFPLLYLIAGFHPFGGGH